MTRFEYECSKGHWIGANAECGRCPCYVHGSPCRGELKRTGAGSRKAHLEAVAAAQAEAKNEVLQGIETRKAAK